MRVGKGCDKVTRYEVTEKTRYSDEWIWLLLLLVIGFVVWRLVSSLAALGIAIAGLIIVMGLRSKGQKRVGDYVELDDKAIILGQNGETYCITFAEIKKVKTSRLRSLLGGPSFIIETSTGTRRWVQPDDYENGEQLREKLTQCFEQLNYLPVRQSHD